MTTVDGGSLGFQSNGQGLGVVLRHEAGLHVVGGVECFKEFTKRCNPNDSYENVKMGWGGGWGGRGWGYIVNVNKKLNNKL